ncbi:MAG: hypothetical protein ABR964_14450 [Tepidisphaeraceae bacterium]
MRQLAWKLALLVALAGCAAKPPAPAAAEAQLAAPNPAPAAAPDQNPLISVIMDKFQVPYGAISQNEAFWKWVDEDALDVPTYELLRRNGLRIGRARVADWQHFREILIDREGTHVDTTGFVALSGNNDITINLTDEMPEQLLFVVNEHGVTGRMYDWCQNRLSFAFAWARHKRQTVRLSLCPVVAVQRKRFDYSLADRPPENVFVSEEYLYDLRFAADIAPGEFLVIGPSPQAADPNRVGNRFLVHDGKRDRYEQLLILTQTQMPLSRQPAGATSRPVPK